MFSIIYCFIPVFLAGYQLYLMKVRESVQWKTKKGKICYHCKEDLHLSDDAMLKRLLDTRDFSQLCVSCNRDRKITQIRNPLIKWKFKFLKFIISENFQKLNIIFMVSVFSVIVLDLVLIFLGFKFRLWPVYGTLNLIYYLISIYKTFYTSTKKPSE